MKTASHRGDGGACTRIDSEATILAIGLTVGLFLLWLFHPVSGKSAEELRYDTDLQRWRKAAVVAEFPFDSRLSETNCGRQGSAREACLISEAKLRPTAVDLWHEADKYERLRCLRQAERAPGPAGQMYVCLSTGAGAVRGASPT